MIVRGEPQNRSTWEAPPLDDSAKKREMFRRAHAMCDEIGLDDDDRHSLARMIPGVDKDGDGSWKPLDAKQLHDLNCMIDGFIWISYLKHQQTVDTDETPE